MTKYLINEEYKVDEPDASRTFEKGERREDFADAWQDTGNVILVGLAGSGKTALAALLAERTGLETVTPDTAEDALNMLDEKGRILVLDDALVENADVQPKIHGAGKVFYLMADTRTMAARVAGDASEEEIEELWRSMSARLGVMEPVFYSILHFIIQGALSPDELVDDALEKIAF